MGLFVAIFYLWRIAVKRVKGLKQLVVLVRVRHKVMMPSLKMVKNLQQFTKRVTEMEVAKVTCLKLLVLIPERRTELFISSTWGFFRRIPFLGRMLTMIKHHLLMMIKHQVSAQVVRLVENVRVNVRIMMGVASQKLDGANETVRKGSGTLIPAYVKAVEEMMINNQQPCCGAFDCHSCQKECADNEGCGRESTTECQTYCEEKWGGCQCTGGTDCGSCKSECQNNDGCRFSQIGYCKRDCEERFGGPETCLCGSGGDDQPAKVCCGGDSCGSCKRECQENEGCGRESTGECKGYCQQKWGPC